MMLPTGSSFATLFFWCSIVSRLITSSLASSCTWTAPGGSSFDLSPLTRKAGQADWMAEARHYRYYLNICADTVHIPWPCRQLGKTVHSPAYQVDTRSTPIRPLCWWLG